MTITLRVQGKDYAILKAEADQRGVSVTALVRSLIAFAAEGHVDLDAVAKTLPRPAGRPRLHQHRAIVWQGRSWSLSALAQQVGMNYSTLRNRLDAGMPVEDAVKRDSLRFGELKRGHHDLRG